ncbi:putative phosphatidylserine decarboxylase [Aspergillus aurantiobrunneus]
MSQTYCTRLLQDKDFGIYIHNALDPTVTALKSLLESDAVLNSLCQSMFAESKELILARRTHPAYLAIDNISTLMRILDYALTRAPEWEDTDSPNTLRGLPFNLALMVLMETPSGLRLFKQASVNKHLKRILSRWASFLESPESLPVLNPQTGWLSPSAVAKLEDVANGPTGAHRPFTEIFDCPDPSNPLTLGFISWDAFFSRTLRPGIRPVPPEDVLAASSDAGAAILNACESRPWQIERHVADTSEFMLKGRSYSVRAMLDNDPLSEHFAKGTVYQAYLSALSYHRWHAPVSGVVRKIRLIDGCYFSQLPMSDVLSMEKSQNYLAAVATRAVIFIEAADPRVGLICFVAVGMGEVSSCRACVKEGDTVQAGDELGSFHYGGSTHCLLFAQGLDVRFEAGVEDQRQQYNIPVRSLLARCFR